MSKDVIIIGCGGHGRVVEEIVKESGDTIYGFLDDDLSKEGVIGKVCDCEKYSDKYFIIAIGNNFTRKNICERYISLKFYTAIHPRAIISNNATVGEGSVVMANAVINTNTTIGKHCIINTAAVVEHDSHILDYVHISPHATLCGTVAIGETTHIGAGAVVKNDVSVCAQATVGAGGVVIHNITEKGTYVGMPVNKVR